MSNLIHSNPIIILEIIAFMFLVMATVTDIKNNTISIGLFPSLLPIALLLRVGLFGQNWIIHAITGITLMVGMLVPVLSGHTGGGDLIMLGSLALCFGPGAIFVIFAGMFAGFILTGAYNMIKERSLCGGIRETIAMSVPLAPYTLAGYAAYIAVRYQFGGQLLWAV